MSKKYTAQASMVINAPTYMVWDAFINPKKVQEYMGTIVETSWFKGSPIIWKGNWRGKEFVDKGEVLEIEKERLVTFSHYSPFSGKEDLPENYSRIEFNFQNLGEQTEVLVTQDNIDTKSKENDIKKNWLKMLTSMKNYVQNNK